MHPCAPLQEPPKGIYTLVMGDFKCTLLSRQLKMPLLSVKLLPYGMVGVYHWELQFTMRVLKTPGYFHLSASWSWPHWTAGGKRTLLSDRSVLLVVIYTTNHPQTYGYYRIGIFLELIYNYFISTISWCQIYCLDSHGAFYHYAIIMPLPGLPGFVISHILHPT